jgi:hypothetical protein
LDNKIKKFKEARYINMVRTHRGLLLIKTNLKKMILDLILIYLKIRKKALQRNKINSKDNTLKMTRYSKKI